MCSWPTLGDRYVENRGQKVGHLAKMYDFLLHSEQPHIALYETFSSKYAICIWPTLGARYAENRGQKVGHLAKMYNFRLHLAFS